MKKLKKGDPVIYFKDGERMLGTYAGDGLNDTLALMTFEDGQTLVVSSHLLIYDRDRVEKD